MAKTYNSLGFTLIELTIVVTIIAILSIFALQTFGPQAPKARDSKRVNEMDAFHKVLEQYGTEVGVYPSGTFAAVRDELATKYEERIRTIEDPGELTYTYEATPSGYCLCAQLEKGAIGNSGPDCSFNTSTMYYCRINLQ